MKALRWAVVPFLVAIFLLQFVPVSNASSIQPPPVTKCSGWEYENLANGTYVGLPVNTCIYGDALYANYQGYGYVNFTEFSLGSSTNPSQTFGLTSGNTGTIPINITKIGTAEIDVHAACGSSTKCHVYLYYNQAFGSVITMGSTIPYASFYSSFTSWKAAVAPSVYLGSLRYLEVNVTGTQTIQFIITGVAYGTFSYSVSGGGNPSPPKLTYTYQGIQSVVNLQPSPTQYAMDQGSTWSIASNPLVGSGIHERWEANSPTLTGTVTSGASFTEAYVFYHQYQGNFSDTLTGSSRTPTNLIPLFYLQYGGTTQLFMSGTYQSIWVDAGSKWSVDNPSYSNLVPYVPSPVSGTMTAKLQQVIAFTAGNSCSAPNPLVQIEQGCVIPGVVGTLTAPTGIQPWFAIILLGVNVAVYNKSQSVMMAFIILMVTGAVFGFLIPAYAQSLGQVLMYLAFAGLGVRLLLRWW